MTSDRPKMPDIIKTTEDNLDGEADDELINLVGSTKKKRSKPDKQDAPPGYHRQVPAEDEPTRAKKLVQKETRSAVVNMRLTPNERERFYRFCEAQNLSLPDGLMVLLDQFQE